MKVAEAVTCSNCWFIEARGFGPSCNRIGSLGGSPK
jgi:hypothetical protein